MKIGKNDPKYTLSNLLLVSALLFGSGTLALPTTTLANDNCQFSRTLDIGSVGEDVRCLQQYLNSSGTIVSPTGVGSPGRETNQYQSLTQRAVISWQMKNGVSPAVGTFGPVSQAKYRELTNGTNTTITTTPTTSVPSTTSTTNPNSSVGVGLLLNEIKDLKDELTDAQQDLREARAEGNSNNSSETRDQREFRDRFREVVRLIDDAQNEYDDRNLSSQDRASVKDDLDDAKEAIYEGSNAIL